MPAVIAKSQTHFNFVPLIHTPIGNLSHNQEDMLSCFSILYRDLYQSKVTYHLNQLRDLLSPLEIPSISGRDRECLNAPLTLKELTIAVLESPNGKAPGTDGLPSEIYKAYEDIILAELLKVFNLVFDSSKIQVSMNYASIIVLLNPDKGHSLPVSY